MSDLINKIFVLIKDKKYEEAKQHCLSALEIDKSNINAYNGLGYVYYRIGTSIRITREGVPDKEAYKRRLHELDKARKYLVEASKIGTDSCTYGILSDVYYHLRAYDASLECYKKIEMHTINKYNYSLKIEDYYNNYIKRVEERENKYNDCEITEEILGFWERETDAYKAFLKEEAKDMELTNKLEWELQKKWFRLKSLERDKYGYV